MLRKVFGRWAAVLALAGAALGNAGMALAQIDPPARVGRLAHIEAGVVFHADRNDPGAAAVANWPVTSGNAIETRRAGRAEVWIGSTGYRLAENSRVEFLAIDDEQVALRVERGSLTLSILDRDQVDDIEVRLPGARVRFQTPGRYRFDAQPDFAAVSVQAGRASFDNGRQVVPVVAGQRYLSALDGREGLEAMAPEDSFDRWVAARENASLPGVARRYVSPRMSGYQDLDAWGEWQTVPEYGAVWYPLGVGIDWAPYRYGRWAWVAPWGWTWIDAAPWGFAPFHYGRWVILGGRWAWVPGQHAVRPVYAPALVGWTGRVERWQQPGRMPPTAWFPLGPREVYVPAYRHSTSYVRQLNQAHVHDGAVIDHMLRRPDERRFMYRQQPGAVTNKPLQPQREFRVQPGRELQRDFSRDAKPEANREISREPNRDLNRDLRGEFERRDPRRDLNSQPGRSFPPGEVRTEPPRRPDRPGETVMSGPVPQPSQIPPSQVQPQSAPTLRIMPPLPQAPAQPPTSGAPPVQPQTALPPSAPPQSMPPQSIQLPAMPTPSVSRPLAPSPAPVAPLPPIQVQPMVRPPVAATPALPMPERSREFREPRAMPQQAQPPAAAMPPSQPGFISPPQGGQMPGAQPHGGREFRNGPPLQAQPQPQPAERRGERPGRERDDGRWPR